EEKGDPRHEGIRWAAHQQRLPCDMFGCKFGWTKCHEFGPHECFCQSATLRKAAHDRIHGVLHSWMQHRFSFCYFPTIQAAYLALGRAWLDLKEHAQPSVLKGKPCRTRHWTK